MRNQACDHPQSAQQREDQLQGDHRTADPKGSLFPPGIQFAKRTDGADAPADYNHGKENRDPKTISEAFYYIGFRKPFWKVYFQIISIMVYRIGAFGQGYHGDTV